MTLRTPAHLEGKPKGNNSMPTKAEAIRRHVWSRSASPVRMARLVNCQIWVPHDATYIHHSMSEVMTP